MLFRKLRLGSVLKDPAPTLIPFVKKGICSALAGGGIIYLDGHNNPGFSGGPVIFSNHYKEDRLQIVGVISGYRNRAIPVLETEVGESPSQAGEKQKKIVHYISENTGIVVSYGVGGMINAIRANPIGFPLSQ